MSSGELTPGTRCPDAVLGESGPGWDAFRAAGPGAYMLVDRGVPGGEPLVDLWIKDPRGHEGRCSGRVHRISVEDDGTVTVAPSIAPRPDTDPGGWHGFLERGVWREC